MSLCDLYLGPLRQKNKVFNGISSKCFGEHCLSEMMRTLGKRTLEATKPALELWAKIRHCIDLDEIKASISSSPRAAIYI